jgi:DNA helicase IV
VAAHEELEAEQAYVDHAYARLAATRDAAQSMLTDAFAQRGTGTPQSVTERDVSVRTSLARIEQLALGDEPLIFGRIDTEPEQEGAPGEAFHIGRLAVSDEDQEPLVVDWRAPIAEPFYRATGRHPMGLHRRRHFLTQGRRITDLEDELFGGEGPDAGLGVGGSTVLLKALERSRTGRMRDIVATVQREQDEIIRAPLHGVLVVQGGPGTGKTAVALHRAAYLLYTHRFPLARQGVLVVGPNPLFLRYIEHVLPSLGESGVELSTIGGLVHGAVAKGEDGQLEARVKGDVRMAKVLGKAVVDRQRPLREEVVVSYGSYRLVLSAAATNDIVHQAKRRSTSHNSRRKLVELLVARKLGEQLDRAKDRARSAGLLPTLEEDAAEGREREPERDERAFAEELRRIPVIAQALERMWPVLSPEELLRDLFGARPLIELAASRWLDADERAALHRRRVPLEEVRWTDGDLALLDEATDLLGPPPRPRHVPGVSEASTELRTFGHIVVDEAQDLTPMQLRMLGRRSLSGSMTIVGDIAQATGPFAPRRWSDQLAHLPTRRGVTEVELSVNYRTPAEIMDLAGRVLAEAAPWLRVPESVRTGDGEPRRVRVPDGIPVEEATAAEVARLVQPVGEGPEDEPGSVVVIAPRSLVTSTSEALRARGIAHDVANARSDLGSGVTVLPVEVVKGLEFDSVVVVEPARLVREAAQGMRSLFVALTRATQRLVLVHGEDLPAALELPGSKS